MPCPESKETGHLAHPFFVEIALVRMGEGEACRMHYISCMKAFCMVYFDMGLYNFQGLGTTGGRERIHKNE